LKSLCYDARSEKHQIYFIHLASINVTVALAFYTQPVASVSDT